MHWVCTCSCRAPPNLDHIIIRFRVHHCKRESNGKPWCHDPPAVPVVPVVGTTRPVRDDPLDARERIAIPAPKAWRQIPHWSGCRRRGWCRCWRGGWSSGHPVQQEPAIQVAGANTNKRDVGVPRRDGEFLHGCRVQWDARHLPHGGDVCLWRACCRPALVNGYCIRCL